MPSAEIFYIWILIFKELIARHLYKSFGVKRLTGIKSLCETLLLEILIFKGSLRDVFISRSALKD
jgi:hypothetical protein